MFLEVVEVIATAEFAAWYRDLSEKESDSVERAVELLAIKGVLLDHPHTSALAGASFALRELRVQSGGQPLRVFYAFDPRRQAVLILGGNKKGDDRFYESYIPQCERIWREYLDDTK